MNKILQWIYRSFIGNFIRWIFGVKELDMEKLLSLPVEQTPSGINVIWSDKISIDSQDKNFYHLQLDNRIDPLIECLTGKGYENLPQLKDWIYKYKIIIVPKKFRCLSGDHMWCRGYYSTRHGDNSERIMVLVMGDKSSPLPLYEHELAHVYGVLRSDHRNQDELESCI